MSQVIELPRATDGVLFSRNLESILDRSWFIFHAYPQRLGTIEAILDGESIRSQFYGDYSSLDRLVQLSNSLLHDHSELASSYLFAAQVDSARHLFGDAQKKLERAKVLGASERAISRIELSIDQALGSNLDFVLQRRLDKVQSTNAIEDWVPLGALLADLGRYDEAHDAYIKGLHSYTNLSPLGLSWACFQLGYLWGEVVEEPDLDKASFWYTQAVNYLPGYTHASVHLAEIHLQNGKFGQARSLLNSVMESGDPEARWRMSELLAAEGNISASEVELEAARLMYEDLLSRHELAFADHAAEFYLGSGNKPVRALELSLLNLQNRSTIGAYEQAIEAAQAAGNPELTEKLTSEFTQKWGSA